MPPTPLDGPSIDLTLIVNPWQAIVAVVIVFALFMWPSIQARQSSRRVEQTLTRTNGGDHVKDQLNRIEAKLGRVELRQAATDARVEKHLTWSDGYVEETRTRLDQLEASQPPRPRRRLFRRR